MNRAPSQRLSANPLTLLLGCALLLCCHALGTGQPLPPRPHSDAHRSSNRTNGLPLSGGLLAHHAGGLALLSQAGAAPETASTPLRRLVWFFGKIALAVTAVLLGLVLLLKLLGYLFTGVTESTSAPVQKVILSSLILGALLALYLLPRSEALVLRQWDGLTGGMEESGFLRGLLFDEPPNSYKINPQGRVVELKLGRVSAEDISELKEFHRLSALRRLEISGTQLAGTLDLAPFAEVETLILHDTRITKLTGLGGLNNLRVLDLTGSAVESLDGVGSAKQVKLSRTGITSLAPLAYASSLEDLGLDGMDLKNVDGLGLLRGLKLLSLRNCRNVDLDVVAELYNLQFLFLDHVEIDDLRPLGSLGSLAYLSIVGAHVSDLAGLEHLPVEYIATDDPAHTPEYVRERAGRPVRVGRGDVLNHTWVPARVRSAVKTFGALLLLMLTLSLAPLPRRWQYRPLLKLRRVILLTAPGALGVLLLWAVVNLDLPFLERGERLPFFVFLERVAWVVALFWLVLLPALLVLRDVKFVRRSLLSVPAFYFSRNIPVAAVAGSLLAVVGYAVSGIRPGGGGLDVLMVFALGGLCGAVGLLVAVFLFALVMSHREFKRDWRKARPYLIFPAALILLLLCASAYIFLNFDRLSRESDKVTLMFYAALPSLFAISLLVGVTVDAFRWRRDARRVRDVLGGAAAGPGSILEVPLRQGVVMRRPSAMFARLFTGVLTDVVKDVYSSLRGRAARAEEEAEVVTAQNVGQVAGLDVAPQAVHTLRGLVIIMQRQDFERSRQWELDGVRELARNVYAQTWAPIWLVGDWFGRLEPPGGRLKRKYDAVEAIMPFLSSIENFSAAEGTVYAPQPPETISACSRANCFVSAETLTRYGIETVLRDAFTPVAVVFRGLFGEADVANRLDALVKSVEVAVATLALLAAAEHESRRESFSPAENAYLDRALGAALNAGPTFKDWDSLLGAFSKRKLTRLAAAAADGLDAPALYEAGALREAVASVGGEAAVSQVPKKIERRKDILPLLVAVRNVITAHGPAAERADLTFYAAVLCAALDFLSGLPWDGLSVRAKTPEGRTIFYKGSAPSSRPASRDAPAGLNLYAVYGSDGHSAESVFDISPYFRLAGEKGLVAFYSGHGQFLEPIFGEQVGGAAGS